MTHQESYRALQLVGQAQSVQQEQQPEEENLPHMFSDILPPEPHVIDQAVTETEASLREYEDAQLETLQANRLWFEQQIEIVKQQRGNQK